METSKNKTSEKGMFHNLWYDWAVPTWLMANITATLERFLKVSKDTIDKNHASHCLDHLKVCQKTPWWRDLADENERSVPTIGNAYLCCDNEGVYIAVCAGRECDGEYIWHIHKNGPMRVFPRYWTTVPHTPYEDLRPIDEVY